ncbi:MAG TPA: SEC-C metal-binding domain-containing protein [Xanthomonadaceae bacterium]|nr:SEC-C metal-binding domain-containing protein [Xanthomonadaceae bacterium]
MIGAQAFLGQSISIGLRDHSPCLCGSGRKYKQCHGRGFPL